MADASTNSMHTEKDENLATALRVRGTRAGSTTPTISAASTAARERNLPGRGGGGQPMARLAQQSKV